MRQRLGENRRLQRSPWLGVVLGMLTTIQACSKESFLPGMKPGAEQGSVNADTSLNTLDVIVSDMLAPHEGLMHGVPASYSWSSKPRVGIGNDAGSWTALTAWGTGL